MIGSKKGSSFLLLERHAHTSHDFFTSAAMLAKSSAFRSIISLSTVTRIVLGFPNICDVSSVKECDSFIL